MGNGIFIIGQIQLRIDLLLIFYSITKRYIKTVYIITKMEDIAEVQWNEIL